VPDEAWDLLVAYAERTNASGRPDELTVRAVRRRPLLVKVYEGLWCGDRWTDVEEWVRWRWAGGGRWHELQRPEHACEAMDAFIEERPDGRWPGDSA
jgi:hypothetical protein